MVARPQIEDCNRLCGKLKVAQKWTTLFGRGIWGSKIESHVTIVCRTVTVI